MAKTKKRRKNKKKVLNTAFLKYVVIGLTVFLVIELSITLSFIFFKKSESIYFDGINSIVSNDKYYVTVGSNNDNVNHYEKAKVSTYNLKKEKTFERLYNVGYNSAFFDVAVDEDNNVIAVGSYEKTEEDHNDLVRRALIVKYDKDGTVLFEKDFSILDNSKFTGVTIYNNEYYVTGQSIYKNTSVGSREGGAVLLKYDKDGNLIWSITYGSSKNACFNDLLIVNDMIYTVGVDDNYLGVICKYDLNGEYITYNDYKYTDNIGFSGIVNIGNRIYVSGANKVTNYDTDAMLVEYDLNCRFIRQQIYNGTGTDRFNKLISDEHNNIIAIGISSSKKGKGNNNATEYNYDGIVGKYKSNLDKVQVVNYGDDRDDYFTDIRIVNNHYLVVGYSSYEDGSYLSKFISYSDALKILEVE